MYCICYFLQGWDRLHVEMSAIIYQNEEHNAFIPAERSLFLCGKHDKRALNFTGIVDETTACHQVFNLLLSKIAVSPCSTLRWNRKFTFISIWQERLSIYLSDTRLLSDVLMTIGFFRGFLSCWRLDWLDDYIGALQLVSKKFMLSQVLTTILSPLLWINFMWC